jgi:hypothetical protein
MYQSPTDILISHYDCLMSTSGGGPGIGIIFKAIGKIIIHMIKVAFFKYKFQPRDMSYNKRP